MRILRKQYRCLTKALIFTNTGENIYPVKFMGLPISYELIAKGSGWNEDLFDLRIVNASR